MSKESLTRRPKPFIAPGSTIQPTAKEIHDRQVKIKRAEEL